MTAGPPGAEASDGMLEMTGPNTADITNPAQKVRQRTNSNFPPDRPAVIEANPERSCYLVPKRSSMAKRPLIPGEGPTS